MRYWSLLALAFVITFNAVPLVAATDLTLSAPGTEKELRDEIRAILTARNEIDEGDPAPDELMAAVRADYRRVISLLYDKGYFGPTVSILVDGREAAAIPVFEVPRRISRITVRVDTGPKFRFGRAELAPLPPGAAPPEEFRRGRTARLTHIRSAADSGVTAWREAGHAKAEVTGQDIVADHPARRLDVGLRITPGPQLRFGRLRPTGLQRLRPERAREIAGLPRGQVFHPDDVERAATRLRRTGVFRSVALTEAERIGPGNTLDIDAALVEQKPRRFGFGAEIDTLDGGTLSAYWLHRNLLGGAERLRIDGRVAGIDTDAEGLDWHLGARLTRPATFGPKTDLYAGIKIESLKEPDYDLDRLRTEIGVTRRISDDLTVSAGLELTRARSRDAFGRRSYTYLSVPVQAELDRRDDRLNPTRGYYLDVTAAPFAGIDGIASGLRTTADLRGYRGFGEDNRVVLAGRLQMGSVIGPDLADAPTDFLFHTGGGGTVRGHPFQSLGVDLGGGLQSGGRSFIAASAELRMRVAERISLVGFYDYGTVSRSSTPGDGGDSHAGAGLGLRYDTGLGPIRLDVATPVTGDRAYDRVELYIGIGQSF